MTPIILLILDGWGESPSWAGNVLNHFNTPKFHQLLRAYFHASLTTFPQNVSDWAVNNVALPYSMIGTGRIQSDPGDQLSRFFNQGRQISHAGFNQMFQKVQGDLHILGFLDTTGVQSRFDHLAAIAKAAYAHKIKEVYFHLGVESDPGGDQRAYSQAQALNQELALWGGAHVVSLFGAKSILGTKAPAKNLRKIFILLTRGEGWHYQGSLSFLFEKYYSQGLADRDFPPSSLKVKGKASGRIKPGDTIIIASLTPESGRPLVKMFENPELLGLGKNKGRYHLAALLDYGMESRVKAIFPFKPVARGLGETLAQRGKKVYKLGPESRRFELGFYFNGGQSRELAGETRQFYQPGRWEKDPLLGADKITNQFYKQFQKNNFDLGVLSLPNIDILARYANIEAIERGVRALDDLIGQLAEKISSKGGNLIITAPFGNAEAMINSATGERHFTHTRNPVPFILVSQKILFRPAPALAQEGIIPDLDQTRTLADIAPTILSLMKIPKPNEMTGQTLIDKI